MGFQSQAGSVGFKTQSVKGTYANPGSGGVFMRTTSGALAGARDLLIAPPEIGGNRDVSDAYLGPIHFEGEYDFLVRHDSLATILYAACGAKSSSSTGSGATLVGTHVITPVNTGSLPWLSIEENVSTLDNFRYTDAKCDTFHLEASADGFLTAKANFLALSQIAVASASATPSPVFDTGPLVIGTNITVAFNSVTLPAKSFMFDLNNNIEKTDYRLGSLFLGDTTEMRREVTAGAKLRPVNNDVWHQAMYGIDAAGNPATSPQGRSFKSSLTITISTYEFITGTTVYSTTISVPQAIVKPFPLAPSGDSVIEYDLTFQFIRPDPNVSLFTATVVNHLATVV